jgi:hypothetical protein
MRIQELLEGTNFDSEEFIDKKGDKREINFDLAEDLMHFMHNDDTVYRRHLYPVLARCLDKVKSKNPTTKSVFKPAVESSYKLYIKKFPIRELDDEIDNKLCEKVCEKLHEEFKEHISDGKYKD